MIDAEGWPFVLVPLGAGAAWVILGGGVAGWVLACLGMVSLVLFRDPPRHCFASERSVCAPVDGRITQAGTAVNQVADLADLADLHEGSEPGASRDRLQITIQPMVGRVRVRRSAVAGRLTRVRVLEQPGTSWGRPRRPQVLREWTSAHGCVIEIEHPGWLRGPAGGPALLPGLNVHRGQRLGPVWPGTRLDLVLPGDARLLVREGDLVRAGMSELAHLASGASTGDDGINGPAALHDDPGGSGGD